MSDWLSQWILGHPIKFALILLALGGVVSISAGDIRRFLSIPPQKLNIWILKARIANAEDRLKTLKKLAANEQQFALFYIGETILYSLLLVFFGITEVFLGVWLRPSQRQSVFLYFSFFVGVLVHGLIVVPQALNIFRMLEYEKVVKKLDVKVRELKLALVAKDPTARGVTASDA